MAKIIEKNNTSAPGGLEKVLLLEPREAYFQPLNLGDWTEVLISCFLSVTTPSSENSNVPTNGVNLGYNNNPTNIFYFGLKNNSNLLPGEPSEYFAGLSYIGSDNGQISLAYTSPQDTAFFGPIGAVTYLNDGSKNFDSHLSLDQCFLFPAAGAYTFSYCGFQMLKIRYINKGLSNQQIGIRAFTKEQVDSSNYSLNALRDFASQNFSDLAQESILNFNVSGVPLKNLNTFILYSPFFNIRFRISSWSVQKLS